MESTINLDDTVFTDPLSAAERDALTRIRRHADAVDPLRAAIATLRPKPKASLAELRRIVELADTAEALIEVPPEVLAREAISETEWPFHDLIQARKLVTVADANDAAQELSQKQLNVKESSTAETICDALEQLLGAWSDLQDVEAEKKLDPSSITSRVDMTMEARGNAISPLVDALIDKSIAMHASLSKRHKTTGEVPESLGVLTERMQDLFDSDKMRQTLDQLHVEIPSHDIFKRMPGAKRSGSKRGGAAAKKGAAASGNKSASVAKEEAAAPATEPVTSGAASPDVPDDTKGKSDTGKPKSAAKRRLNFAGFGADAAPQQTPNALPTPGRLIPTETEAAAPAGKGAAPADTEAAPAAQGTQSAAATAAAEPTPVSGAEEPADGEPLPSPVPQVNTEPSPRAASEQGVVDCFGGVDDPLGRTVPHAPQVTQPPASDAGVGTAARARVGGSAELWKAVHMGDDAAVTRMISSGLCDASLRDAASHSVLWHAAAFGHTKIAAAMLDEFPPQSTGGVDVTETHHRTGDTFLHLLCQTKNFGVETAGIFKRVVMACPAKVFQKVNAAGLTFLQIAGQNMNFWVLSFTLRNLQVHAKALVCMSNNAPMRSLAQSLPQPVPRKFVDPEPFPDYFKVAEMLEKDDGGTIPYADVAFDVGPDSGGVASARFLAHRIVVAGQSQVLYEQLEKLALTPLPQQSLCAAILRVDPRISREVWRSVLKFMYTGIIECDFKQDVLKMVELFRAAVLYKLPLPLLDYAQHCLYPLLPTAPPQIALQVFSICSGTTAAGSELDSAKETSTYIILRGAHKLFESTEPKEACQILERVVQTVERQVFSRAREPQEQAQPQQAQALQVRQQQQQQQAAGGNPNAPVDALSQSFRRVQVPPGASPQVPGGAQGNPAAAANGQDVLSQSWRGQMPVAAQRSPATMARDVRPQIWGAAPGGGMAYPAAAMHGNPACGQPGAVDYLSQSQSNVGGYPQGCGCPSPGYPSACPTPPAHCGAPGAYPSPCQMGGYPNAAGWR